MKIIAHIRHNPTGEIRKYATELDVDEFNFINPFIWEDGNFACDCNRHIFWNDAGLDGVVWDDMDCGDEAYGVNLERVDTSEIFYREYE